MNVRIQCHPEQFEKKNKKQLLEQISDIAQQLEQEAKARCPVSTGKLKNSIHYVINFEDISADIGSDVKYARLVEFGTRNIRAQPYLLPAFYKTIWNNFMR